MWRSLDNIGFFIFFTLRMLMQVGKLQYSMQVELAVVLDC
jgi:hypothetical protein